MVVYRHIRLMDPVTNLVYPKGGFVVAVRINYDESLEVGISTCRDDENFNKSIGNRTAFAAIGTANGFTIPWKEYVASEPLVANVIFQASVHALTKDFDSFVLEKFCSNLCEEHINKILDYYDDSLNSIIPKSAV